MSKFLNKKYRKISTYKPGEQPKKMEYIKLNTNESPYSPGEKVINAIREEEIKKLRLYSDPECCELRSKLALKFAVKKENIYVANGSDDILNFAFMAFADSDLQVMFPEISYGFYQVFAQLHGLDYIKVPLTDSLEINYKDYLMQNKLIVIANPNAPTGLVLKAFQIEEIVRTNPDSVVVIDEAYIDFGGTSCVDLVHKYRNLLVVQTFSKSRSLAGARIGFAIGDKGLIDDLNRIKYSTNPYNVNRLSLAIGSAALYEDEYYKMNCMQIEKTRDWTRKQLEALGFMVIQSKANFLFAKNEKIAGEKLYKKLKENGILVRHFDIEKIMEYNRITIGTPEDMEILITQIKKILSEV